MILPARTYTTLHYGPSLRAWYTTSFGPKCDINVLLAVDFQRPSTGIGDPTPKGNIPFFSVFLCSVQTYMIKYRAPRIHPRVPRSGS